MPAPSPAAHSLARRVASPASAAGQRFEGRRRAGPRRELDPDGALAHAERLRRLPPDVEAVGLPVGDELTRSLAVAGVALGEDRLTTGVLYAQLCQVGEVIERVGVGECERAAVGGVGVEHRELGE